MGEGNGRWAILVWLLLPPLAQSQTTTDDLARGHFTAGRQAYVEGRYEAAVERFAEAYRLSRKPLLLFNLANAYERLGDYASALQALRDYERAAPAGERPTLERRLASLESRARSAAARSEAERARARLEAASASESVSLEPPGLSTALFVASALALGSGATFAILQGQARARLTSELCTGFVCRTEARSTLDEQALFGTAADLSFATALTTALVAGAIWLVALIVEGQRGPAERGPTSRTSVKAER